MNLRSGIFFIFFETIARCVSLTCVHVLSVPPVWFRELPRAVVRARLGWSGGQGVRGVTRIGAAATPNAFVRGPSMPRGWAARARRPPSRAAVPQAMLLSRWRCAAAALPARRLPFGHVLPTNPAPPPPGLWPRPSQCSGRGNEGDDTPTGGGGFE